MTNLKRLLWAALMATALVGMAVAASMEDQIRERIYPVGEVCVAGQDCGVSGIQAAAASAEPRGAEEVYTAACSACHATGAANAPIVGQADAWAPRIEKGAETLVQHAIQGFNAMPPMGGCGNCSEEEVAIAVEYMIESSQ